MHVGCSHYEALRRAVILGHRPARNAQDRDCALYRSERQFMPLAMSLHIIAAPREAGALLVILACVAAGVMLAPRP